MSESVPILKARIDELARANAVFRRQSDEIRHLDGLRRLGEQMLDCSGEAIIATDLQGKIIFWNSYAEKLYGWHSDEVLGQDVVRIVPAAAAVADAENIMARLRKGEAWSGEFQVRARDGREFDVSVTNTPLRDDRGRLMGIIGVSSNVTELKRLRQLRKQAEDHNQELMHDLGERVKELTALHYATRILQQSSGDTKSILDGLASLLPSAFQYPEITAARVRLGSDEAATPNFASRPQELRTEFTTADGQQGSIEIVQTQSPPSGTDEPFLPEERALIDTLADMLRATHDRTVGEKALQERTAQLHALTARLNAVREEEALRIARELHDELGQAMTGMTMELAAVQRQLESDHTVLSVREVQERLAGVRRRLDTTIATTRKICTELRPALLDQMGLLPALEAQAEEFEARTGIFCNVMLPAGEIDLAPDAALAVFRILQEILTNVARHSGATEVTVELAMIGGEVRLEVVDNGRGVTKAEIAHASGLGLIGMRERALAAGGQVLVEPADGRGTRVTLSLPRKSVAGE